MDRQLGKQQEQLKKTGHGEARNAKGSSCPAGGHTTTPVGSPSAARRELVADVRACDHIVRMLMHRKEGRKEWCVGLL